MEDRFEATEISAEEFDAYLTQYEAIVPAKLADLETTRLKTTPEALDQRRTDGDAFLTKAEVVSLVEWKLHHGTFRPSLRSLVASNSDEQVETTTRDAFALLPPQLLDPAATSSEPLPDLTPSLSKLSTLRGIGPATASLLLNTFAPTTIPFFSDELYRWLLYSDPPDTKGPGRGTRGWQRRIGYTRKEYAEIFRRVGEVRSALSSKGRETGAREIELVAYVLGKTGGKPEVSAVTESQKETPAPADTKEPTEFEAFARNVLEKVQAEEDESRRKRRKKG